MVEHKQGQRRQETVQQDPLGLYMVLGEGGAARARTASGYPSVHLQPAPVRYPGRSLTDRTAIAGWSCHVTLRRNGCRLVFVDDHLSACRVRNRGSVEAMHSQCMVSIQLWISIRIM